MHTILHSSRSQSPGGPSVGSNCKSGVTSGKSGGNSVEGKLPRMPGMPGKFRISPGRSSGHTMKILGNGSGT